MLEVIFRARKAKGTEAGIVRLTWSDFSLLERTEFQVAPSWRHSARAVAVNGRGLVIFLRWAEALPASSEFLLTEPLEPYLPKSLRCPVELVARLACRIASQLRFMRASGCSRSYSSPTLRHAIS
jgi:hypothetical protein